MKIGILVGSNRKLSNTMGLAQWVKHHLNGASCEIFTPTTELLTTPINFVAPMAVKSPEFYEDKVIRDYAKSIASCDGFVFISPVYNHSYSGQFKVMIDHLFHEFGKKPVVVLSQGPSAASVALDEMVKLAKKYSMEIVGETAIKIPYEYVSTAQRIAHNYDPEESVDAFLKDHETGLQDLLRKLTEFQTAQIP